MNKFQVLEYNQYYMSMIGIEYHHSKFDFRQFITNAYFFACTFGICVVSTGIFIWNHLYDFDLAVQSSLSLIAGLQAFGCYLNIRLKTKEIDKLNFDLQQIVDEGFPKMNLNFFLN